MARILIVDDDVHSAHILQKLLVHERHKVVTAADGLEALRKVEEVNPDLILLDIMMPGMDGFSVTQHLRADERFTHLPIIVVSAKGQTQDITTGLDSGANDYLAKPIILEELLARVRTQLRLKEAQDSLKQANEDLKRLSDLKGRLVTIVSHELRTPLTSIRAALELVLKKTGTELPSNCSQLLDISVRNTDRLIRLVNEVLDFARLEGRGISVRCSPFSLGALIERAAREVLALGEPDRIRIVQEIEAGLPPAFGDAERLHQVVINLLSNAIKFSDTGGEVRVQARLEQEKWLRVEVTDFGRGIAPEDQPKLFQPFQQLSRPNRGLGGGTGLGLVISKEIVERCGGRIEVRSQPGVGSTFSFTVPRAPSQAGMGEGRPGSDLEPGLHEG